MPRFEVQVEIPDGVPIEEMEEYITIAVANWKGQYSPDEPLFHLDPDSVEVNYDDC